MCFAFYIFIVVTQITRRRYPSGQRFRRVGKPDAKLIWQPDRQQSREGELEQQQKTHLPRPQQNTLRIIPLGGMEEVGRKMTVFEYGNDIVILDAGLQFPEEDMPGIDYIIPDIRYLKGKQKNIRGILLSHGHLDHIGALPHLLPRLNWPTV